MTWDSIHPSLFLSEVFTTTITVVLITNRLLTADVYV